MFLRNVVIRLLPHVPEDTRAHLFQKDPAPCSSLVSHGVYCASS